jgi:sugar O-acyltransferase (sialic acid O-acetyltransferase NeuD family)
LPPRAIDVLGAGGHASVVADVAHRTRPSTVTVWYEHMPDEARFPPGTRFSPVSALDPATPVLLGVGDVEARRMWRRRFPVVASPLVDPTVVVGHGVRIADGVVVMAGCVLNANARIDEDAIVNTGCIVEHDCVVGRNAHLSPGVRLAGAAAVGEDAHVGTGAVVLPAITVGAGSVVGAGAAVTTPVEPGTIVAGVPARALPR